MSTRHRSPGPGLTSFAIYEDPEEKDLVSPSDAFDKDSSQIIDHLLPTSDEAIPSIELDEDAIDGPKPYQTSYTSRKPSSRPRRSSGITNYSLVSAIPSEASISTPAVPVNDGSDTRHTPRKERPRFRNPESVRAMQMSSPPLLPTIETSRERLKGSYKLTTPSRSGRSETPASKKSSSRRRDYHSPRPTPTPQQAPLVLLHVTILPPQVPYSHDLMVKIMPAWLVENYRLLEEKLQDIILMRRGLLIPHPRDEFDLLEERILESLELKTPRLLKCGHFVAPEDDADREDGGDEAGGLEDNTGRGSRMSGGTFTEEHELPDGQDAADASVCADCHHEMKRPGTGIGAGTRRWQVKIYAANGLMPASAWTACWNDMERCDVEISPWIPDELRKTFERKIAEEQEAEKRKHMYTIELQRHMQEASAKQKLIEQEEAERKRGEELEMQKSLEAAAAALRTNIEERAAEQRDWQDAVDDKIAQASESMRIELQAQALAETHMLAERLRALESSLEKQASARPVPADPVRAAAIPTRTLLKNYILILLRDQRNFIILVLCALVVHLALNTVGPTQTPAIHTEPASIHTVAVTTTATATATEYSTLTVTYVQTAASMHETGVPSSSEEIAELDTLVARTDADALEDSLAVIRRPIAARNAAFDASSGFSKFPDIETLDALYKPPQNSLAPPHPIAAASLNSTPDTSSNALPAQAPLHIFSSYCPAHAG